MQRVVDRVRVGARRRPKSTISSSNSSSSQRRRVLARVDQQPAEERRADQAVALRSRSRGRTATPAARRGTAATASCSGYHCSSASSATGECASVHFMFVMRPPVATCSAASSSGRRAVRRIRRPEGCGPSGNNGACARASAGERARRLPDRGGRARGHGCRRAAGARPEQDRDVALHVASEPPGELSTIRFLERVRRLRTVEHPNLLDVYGAHTLEGRCRRGRRGPRPAGGWTRCWPRARGAADAIRIVRQVAAGRRRARGGGRRAAAADPRADLGRRRRRRPPRRPRRRDRPRLPPAASSSAALRGLLDDLITARPGALRTSSLTRARDGAYLSAGQFAAELSAVEALTERRRRETAVAVALLAALVAAAVHQRALVTADDQSMGSNSLSFQVWSNHGSSGP